MKLKSTAGGISRILDFLLDCKNGMVPLMGGLLRACHPHLPGPPGLSCLAHDARLHKAGITFWHSASPAKGNLHTGLPPPLQTSKARPAGPGPTERVRSLMMKWRQTIEKGTHGCTKGTCRRMQTFKGSFPTNFLRAINCEYAVMPRRYLEWDDYFMALAFLSAQRSKDPSKQVCVCVRVCVCVCVCV